MTLTRIHACHMPCPCHYNYYLAVPQAGYSNSAAEGVNFCNFSIASET